MGEVLELEHGPRYGDRFDVTIEELDAKGLGVAQVSAVVGPGKQAHDYRVLVHKVVPGDVLELHMKTLRGGGKVWKFEGRAMVDGELAAEAEIMAMLSRG